MNKPLKQSVQEHLSSKTLSDKQLAELQLIQSKYQISESKSAKFSPWIKMAFLASVCVFSVLSFYFLNLPGLSNHNIAQRIAAEVAENHLKLKPLEVHSDNIQGIKNYFKQLSFLLVKPAFLDASGQSLLGGRYCSIQGITAAQLRIKNNDTGTIQSLYETVYDKNVFQDIPELEKSEQPLTVFAKGMKVSIWVEKDVLFALTEMQQDSE